MLDLQLSQRFPKPSLDGVRALTTFAEEFIVQYCFEQRKATSAKWLILDSGFRNRQPCCTAFSAGCQDYRPTGWTSSAVLIEQPIQLVMQPRVFHKHVRDVFSPLPEK